MFTPLQAPLYAELELDIQSFMNRYEQERNDMSRLTISMPDQERRENAIQELREMLNRAEASGISKRTPAGNHASRPQEAQQKGLLDSQD